MPLLEFPETCDDCPCAMLTAVTVHQHGVVGMIHHETQGFAYEVVRNAVAECFLVARHPDLDEFDGIAIDPVDVLSG